MDLSYFILPNNQKLYIQAIIDNYSRFVLAWQVLESYDGLKTAALLEQALKKARDSKTRDKKLRLIVDGGSENKNSNVKEVEDQSDLRKQEARFEISFSNSMIEAVFRSMKHNYLFSQNIRNFKTLVKHVNFWFKEHNDVMPHTAFNGETPDELFNSKKND